MQNSGVGTYNFFVSQRPALILSGNQIQTYSNRIISTNLHEPSWSTKKIKSKGRKFIHRTSPIRGANSPADAITLRCNHSTSHVKGRSRAASGPRQGAKNTPRCSEKVSSSKKIVFSHSPKSSCVTIDLWTLAWHGITFSFRNAQG